MRTKNVQIVMQRFAQRYGTKMDSVPHCSTVKMMTRSITRSDVRSASCRNVNDEPDTVFDFHATMQEGVHITTENDCYIISVDQLLGGMVSGGMSSAISTINLQISK